MVPWIDLCQGSWSLYALLRSIGMIQEHDVLSFKSCGHALMQMHDCVCLDADITAARAPQGQVCVLCYLCLQINTCISTTN